MNENEMIEDKEQMARIISFELCPQKYHKEWYGEEARCYADNNYADCAKIKEVVDKLYNANVEEYRTKIENGTLVELPCKVGDTVWTINCWQEYGKKELGEPYSVTRYELHENKCSCIEINDKNCYRGEISIIAREKYKGITPYVFLTKAEAEAKLLQLKGEKQ